MQARDRLSADDWRTLQFAPFWMFCAVVGAYRNFDPLDHAAFSRALDLAAMAPGQLNHDVMTSVASNLARLEVEFRTDTRSIGRGLCDVARLLSGFPRDEADMFKHALVHGVGEGVARARGRFGRVMSEDDAKNLEMIAQLLLAELPASAWADPR